MKPNGFMPESPDAVREREPISHSLQLPPVARYLIAILAVILAALARKELSFRDDYFPSVVFYVAVIVSAVVGGWKPGLLALMLGAMIELVLAGSQPAASMPSPSHRIYGMCIYVAVGFAATYLSETRWLARRRMLNVVSRLREEITEHEEAQKKLAAFSKLGQSLSSIATSAEAGNIIAGTAAELFGWDAFSLSLYSEEDNRTEHILHVDTVDGKKTRIPASRLGSEIPPLARRIMNNGAELVLKKDPAAMLPGLVPFGDKARPSASLMFVPLRDKSRTIGVLSIQSYAPNVYEERDLATLQAFADNCGGALQRIRAENEIQRLNAELEQRVRVRTAQLETSNQELEAFSYAVSHDLRAPLRSISGFTRVLKEDYDHAFDEQGRRHLQRVLQSSRQMDQLIEDLLMLSKLPRGEMIRESVDLSALAAEIASELRESEPQRWVEFEITPGLNAHGDPRLVRIALENLMRNAWKFTRKCSMARIEFGRQEVLERGPAYYVRDNGAGFDMAYAGRLFGPFQRLHNAAEYPGHGIGLATVQRVIQRHGGSAWAVGEVDRGAIFYFTLPEDRIEMDQRQKEMTF